MSIVGSEQWMYSSGREFYDFPIEQSLRFNRADSAKLTRTASSPTLGTKATWSFWVKKCDVSEDTSSSYRTVFYAGTPNVDGFRIGFARYSGNNHVLQISQDNGSSAAYIFMRTEAALRDTSTFYHFLIRYDSTDATGADRIKVYINGQLASIQSSPRTNPPLNHIPKWQVSGASLIIGDGYTGYSEAIDMYLAEVNFIDGQALEPTSFGELKSGIWVPVDTSGLSYGTNGFRLQFGDTTEANGFNTVTYNGKGSTQSISGTGFSSSPDLVWIKQRDGTEHHQLFDTVRGAPLSISSSGTFAENNNAQRLQSFDSDGFTLGNDIAVNQSAKTYVAWAWDAGSGSAASNTDGSITSSVKANTDYGFSIATFTGTGANATVGHGLTSAPELVILKNRSIVSSWLVRSSELAANQTLLLENTTTPIGTDYWQNTQPDSSVITVSSNSEANGSGNNLVAYSFHSVTGYSKFGSFTGTGAAGNSITTGFKPAFVLWKSSTANTNWTVADNTRDTSNPITKRLIPNLNNAEDTSVSIDFNDTGFEFNSGQANDSGETFIYMAFADTRDAAFWRDVSGQGNDWQHNNLTFSDVVPDGTNNFAVWSPLAANSSAQFREGNLEAAAADNRSVKASFNMPSGKWYWENRMDGGQPFVGICPETMSDSVTPNSSGTDTVQYYFDGRVFINAVSQGNIGAYTTGDIIGITFDASIHQVTFFKNNTQVGQYTAPDTDKIYVPFLSAGSTNAFVQGNFGQDSTFAGNEAAGGNADENGYGDFAYAPPSGFLSLCSANLPTGAINTLADETPEEYFNTVLYTGTGVAQSITGVGFQPDFTWIKARSAARSNVLYDSVRGATQQLISNLSNAESTASTSLTSFDADGFSIGTSGAINTSSDTLVSWNWKANGAGVSNTDGSITSTVSVGATSQQNWFSIIKWTGNATTSTVGHGLGVVPNMLIVKNLDAGDQNWQVFASPQGNTKAAQLQSTGSFLTRTYWNNTDPTSSVFTISNQDAVNENGFDIICYAFANAEGLCKVGSVVGNGSADGPFIFTGFRPAMVLYKRADSTGNWFIWDSQRDPYNTVLREIYPDQSAAEYTRSGSNDSLDLLSNGFKLRFSSAFTDRNASGGTYIYMAISEQPFKYANAR